MKEDFDQEEKMKNATKIGDITLFKVFYEQKFKDVAVNRYEENDNFFMGLFVDENKQKFVTNMMEDVIYQGLKGR